MQAAKTGLHLQLNKLSKNAKVLFHTNATYPAGHVPLTPTVPCCRQFGNKCRGGAEPWSNPIWLALDFQIDVPHVFQYSWDSDGRTFTATAVGDPDCDGKMITVTARGPSEGGNASVTIATSGR